MKPIRAVLGTALAAALVFSAAIPGQAQQVSASHLDAALDAFRASQSGSTFNEILPDVAGQVSRLLIEQRPDLFRQIETAVFTAAEALANRRSELDDDIAEIWAATFTEEELRTIETFYLSPAGQKFISEGPRLVGAQLGAAEDWSQVIGQQLLADSVALLQSQGVNFGPAPAPAATPQP